MSLRGKKFRVRQSVGKGLLDRQLGGKIFVAEGYWHELTGKSWADWDLGNPAVYEFCKRTLGKYVDEPTENNVIYGHIDGYGHLLHEDELKRLWWKGKKYYEND